MSIKSRWEKALSASILAAALVACGGRADVTMDEAGGARESSEASLEVLSTSDMMPLPKEAGAATSATTTSIVVPILLIPQGSSVTSTQQTTLTQALGNVRRWYQRALPNKNVKWDSLKVISGNRTAAYYLTNDNVWNEIPAEIQQKLGWNPWDTGSNRHIALVIGRDLLGWAGGAGDSGRGLAILGLESLVEQAKCSGNWWCTQEIWHGTAIHELGHGFALPHDSDPLSIMNFHGDYTNKYFVAGHVTTVEGNPAVEPKLANWAACSNDFGCVTKRCGGNYGNQIVCLPSTAYPKEAVNIPNGSICRTGSQCQSGRCELLADGYKVCSATALPQYVTPFFQELAFQWSSAGPVAHRLCTLINEPLDPNTWNDNYLCSNGPHEFRWSYSAPLSGKRCTLVNEPADPHAWHDNYLCVPTSSSLQLQWSYSGPIAGKACILIIEVSDPYAWNDNYLCY